MKILPLYVVFLTTVFLASHLKADVSFLFNDAPGTNASLVTNDGDISATFGSTPLRVGADGTLNIGFSDTYKAPYVNGNNTLDTISIGGGSPISSGTHLVTVKIKDHDISGSWKSPAGIIIMEKDFHMSVKDSFGNGAKIGLTGIWNVGAQASELFTYSDDTNSSVSIAQVDSYDIAMGDTDIVLEFLINLDDNTWTTTAKQGTTVLPLVQDGSGISNISEINIHTSFSNPSYAWGANPTDGVVSDFVLIDEITVTEVIPESTADINISGSAWGANNDSNLLATASDSDIGDIDQANPGSTTLQIIADLNTGLWASRYKVADDPWNALVTDGEGIFDINRIQLNVKTPEVESWGSSDMVAANGDYIKIDSVKVMSGTGFDQATADVTTEVDFFVMDFESDAPGTNILGKTNDNGTPDDTSDDTLDPSVSVVANIAEFDGAFNFSGHLTDGSGNLNVGYAGSNEWVNNFEGSYRTYTFGSPVDAGVITATGATGIVVFEVVVAEYDLSKSWDTTNTIGSYDGKGLQVSIQNSSNAGAAINLFTDNKIVPGSVIQLDFDDVAGTTLFDGAVYSGEGYTGTWNFGGPQTDGEGNLNIGYSGANKWTGIYGDPVAGNSFRTFTIDSDADTLGDQPITSGRYILEASFNPSDLSGQWKNGDNSHLVSGKGLQIMLRGSDNSGAVVNFFSHVSGTDLDGDGVAGDYQVKAQTNTWGSGSASASDGMTQAFGLNNTGEIDIQIRANLNTGQWTTHAKSSNSDTWKDMELGGTGLNEIASIQINPKTPIDTAGVLINEWGDETLNGNAPEAYVDANGDGQFNAGTTGAATDTPSNSGDFDDTGNGSWPYAYTAATPAAPGALPEDASISISSDGSNANVAWSGTVVLEESDDLSSWTEISGASNPHSDALSGSKFFRLTAQVEEGASSSVEQNFVINVTDLGGGANYSVAKTVANGNWYNGPAQALVLGENSITVSSVAFERSVKLRIDGDISFSSFTHNGTPIFVAGETYTDENGNGQRDPGNAALPGDYVKLDYIRITNDASPDNNNSISVQSKSAGTISGTAADVAIENSSSQSGSLQLKIDANLSTGVWSSAFSTDEGETWTDLVTDGAGLYSIGNFTLASKTHQYDAWGDGSVAAGTAGDNVKIDAVTITGDGSPLISFDFEEATGTWMRQQPGSTFVGEAANSGSFAGAWNFGGPRLQDGNLNIGYTEHWRWTAPSATAPSFRKYITNDPITHAEVDNVQLIVDISSYNLSRSWDNGSESNINSFTGKGMIFRIDSTSSDYATVEFGTVNAAQDIILGQDADGDGQPDFIDPYPNDPLNGIVPSTVYVNNLFEDADGTDIRDTIDDGSLAPTADGSDAGTDPDSWNYNGAKVINGNLVWGYGDPAGVNNYSDANTGTKFRTKVLLSDVTEGVAVFETVISGYDLSKSWTSSSSQYQKGFRVILKNGTGSPNRQGAAINLWVNPAADDVMVEGQTWYTADGVILSTGNVRSNQGGFSSSVGVTLQIVVDTDTGYFYTRYKKNNEDSWTNLTEGTGFTNIDNIQITHKTPAGDAWGDDTTTVGDYVLIDSITLKDNSIVGAPVPAAPASTTDADGDGILDHADWAPNDDTNQYDFDGDGVGNGDDADDNDASVQ